MSSAENQEMKATTQIVIVKSSSKWRIRNRSIGLYFIFVTLVFLGVIGMAPYFTTNEAVMVMIPVKDPLVVGLTYEGSSSSSSESDSKMESLQNLPPFPADHLQTWEAPEDVRKNMKYYLAGHDLENRPVWVVPFGQWRVRELLEMSSENEQILETYLLQFAYRVDQSRLLPPTAAPADGGTMTNETMIKWVLICDMDQYTYSQFTSISTASFLLRLAKSFQSKPDSMAYGFVINLGWISNFLIKTARPVLGPSLDKMMTFETDKEAYIVAMLNKIHGSQLPSIYGGSENFKPMNSFD